MATVSFKINLKAKNDPTKIYVRFRGTDFDCETPTQFLIPKKDWSNPKQKVKATFDSGDYRNKINPQLSELKEEIINRYNEDNHKGIKIQINWLKNLILNFHNKPSHNENDIKVFLTSFSDKFSKEAVFKINSKTGEKLNLRTVQDYQNSSNKLKAFETYIGKKINLTEIDFNFHSEFIKYLRSEEFLGENTIKGIITNLKAFLREADRLGYKVNPSFKDKKFSSPSFKPKDIYFNEEEIEKIRNHTFDVDYLDNARDWLIIGVWTGLRVSDLLQLTKKDIKEGFIDNTNFKTNIPVTIPIHPHVKEILDKRNGEFPRKISDQNFNDYIKKVAEKVGFNELVDGSKNQVLKNEKGEIILDGEGKKIHRKKQGKYPKWELVTSHICRRSFASNLYGKIDTLTIMKITGHTTEKQFLDYIKITPKHHAEKLSQLWAKLYS
ncbi:tyrosine-type recombinase/integrase [Flavobacterium lacisediminis]|uniref:Site-specific integrase n=1 Tax=Flavobacterium lacisediminis TaxID=2989705 RepID=A0ABT3EIW4_9FLAO|nr:site-specific integrase [Flavobacterium lacisediminis]MCW1148049.1 site-specific integrase [Flavobacterium lacisediminis]